MQRLPIAMGQTRKWRSPRGTPVLASTTDIVGVHRHVRKVPLADSCTAAEAASYSITSSARASSVGGMLKLIDFAVLMLITSSDVVGCSIGISLGLAPATILLT